MAEYINGSTDILGGSVIRYALNTTTPNQAVIRKIIAGNGISISSTGIDPGTGDVTISIDTSGTGGSGAGGGTPTAVGTVTSVNMTAPEGLFVLGAPITNAGTIALRLSSGYIIPLIDDVQKGINAYNDKIVSLSYNTSSGVITLTKLGGGSMIAAITLSPFTTSDLTEGTNLYYTNTRARSALSFVTGSGAYNSSTGVITIPTNTNELTNGAGFITGNQLITLSGDVSGSGTTAITTTLATITQSTGSSFVKITLDTKGRVIGNSSVLSADIITALGYTPYDVTNPAGYQVTSEKGVANGYASLNSSGQIPSTQLPSYVDDVLEYANLSSFPGSGETGKIYVTLDTNKTYRWSGSAYIEISASPGSTDAVTEGSINLYFTNARARAAISLTTTGDSGASTYSSATGVINVPTYTLTGLGGVSTTRTLTINGIFYDLSADRTWSVGTVTGSGTTNYIPKWTSSTSLGNSLLDDDGIGVAVALAAGGYFSIRYLSAIKLALTGGTTFGSIDVPIGLDFLIRPDSIEKFKLSSTGLLKLANYGSGSVTGTATYRLAVDSVGNVIEVIDGGGTVTSVSGTGTVSGLTLTGTVTGSGSLTLGGTLTLTSGQVTTALGYTPYNATNPSGYISSESDTLTSVTGRGASTPANMTIANANPVFILKDTDNTGTGAGQMGYISFVDSSNIERAWIGYGSPSSTALSVTNGKGDVILNPSTGNAYVVSNLILHGGNYNSYAPTLTGGGASGNWNINSATSTLAANSTLWNSQAYYNSTGVTVQSVLVYDNVNAVWRPATSAQIQTWLGLGSNAYTSTAYLPLTGGTLTGALGGTSASFSSSVTATSFSGGVYPYNSILGSGADASTGTIFAGSTGGFVSSIDVAGGGATNPNTIIFKTASVERLRIASTGEGTFTNNVTINGTIIGTDQTFGGAYRTFAFGVNSNSYNRIFATTDATDGIYINAATGQGINFRVNGGGSNVLVIASTGAATFSSSVSTTFINVSQSGGQIGSFDSTNANGGYITWSTSGTTIADLGTAQQIFGTGGNDTFGINARGARALVFGTNNTERLRIASTGAATFSSSVKSAQYLIAPNGNAFVYNIVDATDTYTGAYAIQAGAGSAGYGGAILLYGHSHATKPGWVTAGISANSSGKFTVNTQGAGGGTDVFTVTSTGAATFNGSVTASSLIKSGGTSAQFLMADGTVSTNPGWITSFSETDTLASVTARGATTSTSIAINAILTVGGGADFYLRAPAASSDPGDIVFQDGSGAELHRLWSGPNTLYYRTNGGTTYLMWHSGNLTNLNQLTNGPGYITGESDTLASVTGRGSTTTIAIGAPNFYDGTGSYNVNLGSGGSEGRGLVVGYSGGSYGGIGYNVRHTATGGSWIAPGTDTSSYILFTAGGFTFYGASSGTAGRAIGYTTLGSFTAAGLFNAVNITVSGNQVWHAGNDGSTSGLDADLLDGNHASAFALINGNTGQSFGVFELSYAMTAFNPSAAPRTALNPMSIKMWDNYFAGTGLGSDYGTVLEYYGRSGHVDTQVYFDASGGNWYRTASYGQPFGVWQQYWTSANFNPGAYLPLAGGTLTGQLNGTSALFNSIVTSKTVGNYRQSTPGTATGAGLYITNVDSGGIYGLLIGSSYSYGDVWLQSGRTDGNTSSYNISLNASGGTVTIGTVAPQSGYTLTVSGAGYFGSAVASTSMSAPIFYDSADTSYYLDPNSSSRLYRVNSYYLSSATAVSDNHEFGIYFDSGLSTAYAIYRNGGPWDYPYPDLRIAFHTGIQIGANANYNGVRFYTDYDMVTQVMSVNNTSDPLGGSNVYVNNSLQAGSSLRAPIFYDSQDTSYYLNPNGQSVLYSAQFNAVESINLYGVRGRFTNEYIHLYSKVGIGDPNGWGAGETSTPGFGLSTYGGANFAYGNGALSTFNGQVNIKGSSMYVSASQLHIGQQSAGTAQMSFESWGAYTGAIAMNSAGAFTFGGQGASSWNWRTYCTSNGDYTTSGNTVLSLSSGGSLVAVGDMRAPIFYDSQDTSYYVDPNGLSVLRSLQIGAHNQYSITLPSPSANYGNGRIYIRLHTVQSRIVSFKISISSTWNWAAAFGFVSADVSYYCDGTNLYYPTTTITSATGEARSTLTLGNPVIENGYVSIPVYSANTNAIFVKFEGAPSFDWNLITTSGWESFAWPGSAVVNIPGALTTGGNITMVGNLVATQSWVNSQGFVTGGPYLPLTGGTLSGALTVNGRITANGGGTYAVTGSSNQRYIIQALNTSNNTNPSYGWWWFHETTTSDMGFHADAVGDILTLGRSGDVYAATSFRAPIFYDSNDTNYYLNPNGSSNLYSATFNSTVNLQGTNWFGGYGPGSGPGISFENQGTFARIVFWGVDFYDWNHGRQMLIDSNYVFVDNYLQAGNSLRAPIFYDSSDTNYYVDPNSTSRLSTLVTEGYIYSNQWIQFSNYTGLYSPNNGAHFRPNNASYGPWLVSGTRNGWSGIEFESLSAGNVALMIKSNEVGTYNTSYGWQYRWTTGTMYVYKDTYGGGTAATVLDSVNYNSYSPTLTGGGASGTWSINISGNAATATTATNLYGLGSIQRTTSGTGYGSMYQIREAVGYSGDNNIIGAPALGFHWGGLVASSILMEASGRISIRNNPGTAYEAFIAGAIYGDSFNGAGTGLTGTAASLTAGAIVSQANSATITASTSPTANTIAQRDANGYIQAVYFYSSNSARSTSGINSLTGKDAAGAGYLYEYTAGAVQSFLGLGSNAYSSTAYLPTAGGNLSGNLNGTSASFSSSVSGTDFYASSWFRTTGTNGLYNSTHDTHFYASGTGQWNFATSNLSWIQIALRPAGHESTVRGYLYADTSNNVGLLTNDGNWALRMDVNKNAIITGYAQATSYYGAGTGLTGTAASLSIGGNAATATNVTTQVAGVSVDLYVRGQHYGSPGANPLYDTGTLGRNVLNMNQTFEIGKAGFIDVWGATDATGMPPSCSHVQGVQSMHYLYGYGFQMAGQYDQDSMYIRQMSATSYRAWRKIIDSGNIGSQSVSYATSAGNATTAGGLAVHTGTNNEANKIVRTEANGYVNFGWINTVSGDNGTTAIGRIYASEDAYLRYYTPANFISVLGLITTGNFRTNLDGTYFHNLGFTGGGSDANTLSENRSAFTYAVNAPLSGAIAYFGASGYGIQLNGDYTGDSFSMRSRNGDNGTWRPWKRLLTDYNYNSYAPTLTGGGASGTWGISISGNAATATSATSTNAVNSTGFGNGQFTWYQGSIGLQQYTGSWASFLISNHGDGSNYYNQTIIMPFWGVPQYMRKEGNVNVGPYTFLSTENYNSYSPTLTGGNASGSWGISITGSAATAGSAATVTHNASRTDGTLYNIGWFAGNPSPAYSCDAVQIRSSDGTVFATHYRGSGNVGGTGEASHHPAGIYSNGTNWLYGTIYLNGNTIYDAYDIYNSQWFRNNNTNTGLYNQVTTQHWSSGVNGYWDASSTTTVSGIRFYTGSHLGTLRGYVYADNGNNIGFLNTAGSWSLRCDNSGNVTATGDVTAYSDARVKENVVTIENALDKTLALRGVSYNRNDNQDKRKKVGVIAQEIQEVIPEVVTEDSDGMLGVSYGNLAGVFIEAIKEQQKQIEDLKKQIAYLVENK